MPTSACDRISLPASSLPTHKAAWWTFLVVAGRTRVGRYIQVVQSCCFASGIVNSRWWPASDT